MEGRIPIGTENIWAQNFVVYQSSLVIISEHGLVWIPLSRKLTEVSIQVLLIKC